MKKINFSNENRLFVYILLIINVVLIVLLVNKSNRMKFTSENSIELVKNNYLLKIKNDYYSQLIRWLQVSSQTIISGDLKLRNEDGDDIFLNEVIDDKPKLIFRYSELDCNICIESQINFIKDFLKKHDKNDLVMLANYKNSKSIDQFKIINDFNHDIYNVEILDSTLLNLNFPFYFILDNKYKPKMFFFPSKSFPEETKSFFQMIEKMCFNSHKET